MLRKLLLLCGPISSVLYLVAIDVLAPLRYPDYHDYTSQMVSELFAEGAPTRPLILVPNTAYNLLVFAFAGGVWLSDRGRPTRLAVCALIGYGVTSALGLYVAQMDLRGTIDSERDPIHIGVTILMSTFIVATIISGAFVHRGRFRLLSIATVLVVLVFGALAGYLATPMPGPTPWLGLAERVNIYATMSWLAAFGMSLWATPTSSRTRAFVPEAAQAGKMPADSDHAEIGTISEG